MSERRSYKIEADGETVEFDVPQGWIYAGSIFPYLHGRSPLNGYTLYLHTGPEPPFHPEIEQHTVINLTEEPLRFYTVPPCGF